MMQGSNQTVSAADAIRPGSRFVDVSEVQAADRGRRIAGGLYGLLLGLIYALTAGTIDRVIMSDVALRTDWTRVLAAVLVTSLLGLGLGVLTAWPQSFVKGVIFGGLGIAIGGTLQSLVVFGGSIPLSFALIVTLLPRAALSAPIALVMRGLTQWHEDSGRPARGEISPRYWLPLAAILIGLVFGSLSQMPPEAKAAVRQTDVIVQNALNAADPTDLPSALARIPDFQARAGSSYLLDQRAVPFSAQRLIEVRVYFDNGFVVSCLYVPNATPACEAATPS